MSKRGTATSTPDARATNVWFDSDALHVTLADGRDLTEPLSAFPRLSGATSADRAVWELIGDGEGIHWPRLDEDISVAGMLRRN